MRQRAYMHSDMGLQQAVIRHLCMLYLMTVLMDCIRWHDDPCCGLQR